MKKKKNLVIMMALLAVLVGAYVLVTSLTAKPDVPDDGANDVVYEVLSVNAETLTRLSYTLDGKTYSFTVRDDLTGWVYDDDPELPLSNAPFSSMMSAVSGLQSDVCYEGVSEERLASEYGIGAADAVTVCFSDSVRGDRTIRFGKTNAFNGKVYVAVSGQAGKVYMVPASACRAFSYKPEDMVADDSIPTVGTAKLRAVRLTRGDTDDLYSREIGSGEEGDVWTRYPAGGEGEVISAEAGESILNAICAIKLTGAVSFHAADRATYGLSDEDDALTVYYTATVTSQDAATGETVSTEVEKTYRLLLGNRAEDGAYYVRLPDGNGIYRITLPDAFA